MTAPTLQRYRPRRGRAVVVVVLLLLVNLPLASDAWAAWRLGADGVTSRAEVVDTLRIGGDDPRFFVAFRLPGDDGPERFPWVAELTPRAWEEAERDGAVTVTSLPGDPSSYRVEGERRGRGAVWVTLGTDVLVLLVAWLVWRWRRRAEAQERRRLARVERSTGRPAGGRPGPLRLVALDDLVPAPAHRPHGWSDRRDGTVELCGDVVVVRDAEVEVVVEDRRLVLALGDHRNAAGFGERAVAVARLADPA